MARKCSHCPSWSSRPAGRLVRRHLRHSTVGQSPCHRNRVRLGSSPYLLSDGRGGTGCATRLSTRRLHNSMHSHMFFPHITALHDGEGMRSAEVGKCSNRALVERQIMMACDILVGEARSAEKGESVASRQTYRAPAQFASIDSRIMILLVVQYNLFLLFVLRSFFPSSFVCRNTIEFKKQHKKIKVLF